MKLIHLSHTDLDGYSCHLLTKEYFKEGLFINANYGLEVKLSLKRIVHEIEQNLDEEILVLISDLNLTLQEAKELDKSITDFNENGAYIKLQLLDHHVSGQKAADKYDWYYLDISRCATKIVYDYICNELNGYEPSVNEWLEPLVNAINAIDIWLDDQIENFEFGKVLLRLISKATEINQVLFSDENREYRLYLLREAARYVGKENGNILLDNEVHFIKKRFLQLDDIDDTIDNLSANRLVHILETQKDNLTVMYKGHKGLLTFTLGSISIPANAFLKANKDYDFFIDIGRKGHTSFRADGKLDMNVLASKLAKGGGHPNASGARFVDFKETIHYSDVKKYIENKLKGAQ
ncbi:MAG: phosphoesterase [Campylobacteraceae bacterium]|nr:phosphoesterase [Campylobacteraceae bacterium]